MSLLHKCKHWISILSHRVHMTEILFFNLNWHNNIRATRKSDTYLSFLGKKIQITDNMSTVDRVVLCASEICGTFILVFLGCAGCLDFSANGGPAPNHLQICITFGLAVMIAVQVRQFDKYCWFYISFFAVFWTYLRISY